MRFLIGVLALAVVLGYVLGGRLRNVEKLRLRWWGLAPLGLALQLAPVSDHGFAVGLLIASYPILIAFCIANIRLAGFALILVGLALNMVVISANQGMPVSKHALDSSGQGALLTDLEENGGAKHFLATPDNTVLEPLADVIPIGDPFNQVLSAGDLLVYLGVVWLIVAAMRGRPVLFAPKSREVEPTPV
jgi:Family of unknown function (DUF5317)